MAEGVIRKRDPSKRKDIRVVTLKKVEEFLKAQDGPVFRSDIVKGANVDYHSVIFALEMLPIKTDSEGRISIKKGRKKDV